MKKSPYFNLDYQKMRGVTFWIHNSTCYGCKSSKKPLDIHHINNINTDNRIFNLMPLCRQCHQLAHKSKKMKEFTVFYILELIKEKIKILESKR